MKSKFNNLVNLLLIVLLSSFILACQKPEKKASDASIYSEGVDNLEKLAQSIKSMGIDLDSETLAQKIGYTDPKLKHRTFPSIKSQLRPGTSIQYAKSLLTEFVIAANKLLELGNSKTVVFPEKEKIMKQNHLASFFLADIFFRQKFSSDYESSQISVDVDHHEFELRFARFSLNIKWLSQAGYPLGDNNPVFPKKNRLKAIEKYQASIEDAMRMNFLLRRNNNFQSDGYAILAKNMLPMAGYFYGMIELIKKNSKK